MKWKSALAALAATGTVSLAATATSPAQAMGPVGPSTVDKTNATTVEMVHRRWYRRSFYRYGYYPRARYYRPYYYSSYYDDPYYDRPYYYRPSYRPYYGFYGPRFYGGGVRVYGPRFGVRIGW